MPSVLHTFAASEARVRWRESFLTEGINAKLAVNTPPGIYKGFRVSGAAALSVDIDPEVGDSDHVAVYETSAKRSLSIRKTGGSFTLSLAAYASKTVVLALYATYSVGATTAAYVRVYELDPTDEYTLAPELDELIGLSTVVVPASGAIPDANISPTRRKVAWEQTAPGAVAWAALLRNPSFEWAEDLSTASFAAAFWETGIVSGTATWRPTPSDANTGNRSLEYVGTIASSTGRAYQWLNVPVSAGQFLKIQAFVRVTRVTTGGAVSLFAEWGDSSGAALSDSSVAIDTSATAPFAKYEAIVAAPAGATHLRRVGIRAIGVTYASAGDAFRADDFQCWLETTVGNQAIYEERVGHQMAQKLALLDTLGSFADLAALLRFDSSTPSSEGRVIGERLDQDAAALPPAFQWLGRLFLGEGLLNSAADARRPRVTIRPITGSSTDFTLVLESVPTSQPGLRLYANEDGNLFLTINAAWTGTDWDKDVNGQLAGKYQFKNNALLYSKRLAANNANWADTAWDENQLGMNQLVLGSNLLSSEADALLPRVSADASTTAGVDFTLMWYSNPQGGGQGMRLYVSAAGVLILTRNASWDGSLWSKDTAGQESGKYEFSASELVYKRRDTSAGTWSDTAWTDSDLAFKGTFSQLGADMLASAALALIPRIEAPVAVGIAGGLTLLWQSVPAGVAGIRLYGSQGGELVYTFNASWDSTNWTKDVNGQVALRYGLSQDGVGVKSRAAVANTPWTDTTWSGGTDVVPVFLFSGTSQAFSAGYAVLGLNLLSDIGKATTGRVQSLRATYATSARSLYAALSGTESRELIRFYQRAQGGADTEALEIVVNASWSALSTWAFDVGGSPTASKMVIDKTTIKFFYYTGADGWVDSAWILRTSLDLPSQTFDMGNTGTTKTQELDLYNGILKVLVATASPTGSNITPATVPVANTLYAKSMPKAWANVSGASGAGPVVPLTLEDGFNVSSVSYNNISGLITVDFHTDLANDDYAVVITVEQSGSFSSSSAVGAVVVVRNPASPGPQSFGFNIIDSAGNIEMPSAATILLNILVFGTQN